MANGSRSCEQHRRELILTRDSNTVASVLVETLHRYGVDRIFALSGNQVLPIFEAAFDAGIEIVHVRHEAAAVHMADAWGRLTDAPGVAVVAAGTAHGNALGALLTALHAESPMLLLSGQTARGDIGRGGFQEAPHAEMAAHMTKRSWSILEPGAVQGEVSEALRVAASGRPGPVHIAVPYDVLGAPATSDQEATPPEPIAHADRARVSVGDISGFLGRCNRPLVLVGPAMMRASGTLSRLSDATGVPVIATESPRGVDDPSLGRYREILGNADGVVLLGKRLDWSLAFADAFDPACRFLQIDADAAELERTARLLADSNRLVQSLEMDPATAASALVEEVRDDLGSRSWRATVGAAIAHRPKGAERYCFGQGDQEVPAAIHPAEVCRAIQPWLDNESVHVGDGGEFGQWAQALLAAPHRIVNGPAGAIGASIPFAIAAKQAMPDSRVIATLGDGSFGFHAMEFDTAVRYGVPFVAVVGNDARWNTEYQRQLGRKGARYVAPYQLLPTRYDLLVEALGGHGEYVTDFQRARRGTRARRCIRPTELRQCAHCLDRRSRDRRVSTERPPMTYQPKILSTSTVPSTRRKP